MVRSGDMIIAEHNQAQAKGMCITQIEHLEQLWKLTVKQTPLPHGPDWKVSLSHDVQQVNLDTYDGVNS